MKSYDLLVTKKVAITLEFENPIENIDSVLDDALSESADEYKVTDCEEESIEQPSGDYYGLAEFEAEIQYQTHCTDSDATWGFYGGSPAEHDESICISDSDVEANLQHYFKEKGIDISVSVSESSSQEEELSGYDEDWDRDF